jgi:mRNA interferase HigB
MRIINSIEVDKFKRKHPQSRKPFFNWETVINNTDYRDLNALKATFAKKADYLASGYTVFDIGGNKYRLITEIDYFFGVVEIKIVWTHNEYSNPKNQKDLRDGKI